VLTFEEMAGMMEAKQIDYLSLADDNKSDFDVASADGSGFAVAGGVATAVVNAIHRATPTARSTWPMPRASRTAAR
jgi:CO/xanthine dehydrogenase Mo-binding subunit